MKLMLINQTLLFSFFLIGIHSSQDWKPLQDMESHEKEEHKDEKNTGEMIQKMSVITGTY